MDLLNLARTSKPFKQLLVDRTAARFWRAARENIKGLPDCPSFLSEPAYANLCFDAHCHVCHGKLSEVTVYSSKFQNCLKPNIQTVHWEVKARYCQPCMNEVHVHYSQFIHIHILASLLCIGIIALSLLKVLTHTEITPYLTLTIFWGVRIFYELVFREEGLIFTAGDVPYSIRRHKLSVKAIMEAWRQTPAENRAEFRIEYTARRKQLLAVSLFNRFYSADRLLSDGYRKFASDYEKWFEMRKKARSKEIEETRQDRFNRRVLSIYRCR